MRRDGPEGPELPCGRHQPEKEEPVPPGQLRPASWPSASCCSSFSSLQLGPGPLGRGLHQHLGHRGRHGPRRPHRRGPDGGLLRVPGGDGALYRESHRHRGEILRQTPVPALRQTLRKHGDALDSLEIPVACHGGENNRLDDQLDGPGFPDVDDHGMGPPVRVGRGGWRGPEHPGGPVGNRKRPRCPPVLSSPLGFVLVWCMAPSDLSRAYASTVRRHSLLNAGRREGRRRVQTRRISSAHCTRTAWTSHCKFRSASGSLTGQRHPPCPAFVAVANAARA